MCIFKTGPYWYIGLRLLAYCRYIGFGIFSSMSQFKLFFKARRMLGLLIWNGVITLIIQQKAVCYLITNKCLLLSALMLVIKFVKMSDILPLLHILVTSIQLVLNKHHISRYIEYWNFLVSDIGTKNSILFSRALLLTAPHEWVKWTVSLPYLWD